jgi:hypothetical protein
MERNGVEELTLWQEDHPAKTSQWLEIVAAWMVSGADCSGINAESLMKQVQAGSSGKTLPALYPATKELISLPCCGGSQEHSLSCPMGNVGANQGSLSGRNGPQFGGCLTLNGSEWPSDAVVSTLSQALENSVDQKYFLSPKACAGILRRAGKRGKKLPELLEAALVAVAGHRTSTE